MPLLSAFTPCGLLELSAEPSDAESIYATLKAQLEPAFTISDSTYEGAEAYAMAMQLAWARAILKRVPRELHPATTHDLLTTLESDWACTPTATDTLYQRQLRLVARKLLMRGSREEAIVTDLTAAIGADFIKLNACPTASAANYPTTADTVGTFPKPALSPKFYKLTSSVPVTGKSYAVKWSAVNASAAPLVGEKLTVEPDISGWSEAVSITAVTTDAGAASSALTGTLTAVFTNSHSANAWAITSCPDWLSNRYQLQIVVSDKASRNAIKRQSVHGVMSRHANSCERWKIVAASSSTQVGPFVFGLTHNYFGATALGATAVNF